GVERRGLALERHAALVVEERGPAVAEVEVAADLAAQGHRPQPRHRAPLLDREVAELAVEDAVTPALALEHQHEGGVLRDVDRPDRVPHEEQREDTLLPPTTP